MVFDWVQTKSNEITADRRGSNNDPIIGLARDSSLDGVYARISIGWCRRSQELQQSQEPKRLSCRESNIDGWEKPPEKPTNNRRKLGKLAKHTRK